MGLMGIVIFIAVLLLIDLYSYKGIKDLTRSITNLGLKRFVLWGYWFINIVMYSIWIYIIIKSREPNIDIPYKFAYFSFGIFLMLFALVPVVLCDAGAYFAGRAWGKRKLAPEVSIERTSSPGVSGSRS